VKIFVSSRARAEEIKVSITKYITKKAQAQGKREQEQDMPGV